MNGNVESPLSPWLAQRSGWSEPAYLADHGHEVINPTLDDKDFAEAMRVVQAEYDRHRPGVIIGSSRSGAVAMNINSGDTPLILLCPAWKRWGTATTVNSNTIILHSRADDTIPFIESEELVENSDMPKPALIEVGTDYRLAEPAPLSTMLEACEWSQSLHRG